MSFLGKWVSSWIITTLCLSGVLPEAAAQDAVSKIDIEVVTGEGAAASAGQRVAVVPAVRVVDQNSRPVRGAVVMFNLPVSGTSGEFANGGKNLSVLTDLNGTATATGLRANGIPGRLQILVTASYRGNAARGFINQNVQATGSAGAAVNRSAGTATPVGSPSVKGGGGGGHGKLIVIIAVIGGAAAGGAFAALHKGGSSGGGSPTTSPIGITPGTGTISPPH